VQQVAFDMSDDATNYMMLGSGTRVAMGWRITGLSLPIGRGFYLRARGRTVGGRYNGSNGLIESVRQFYLPPRITSISKLDGGTLTVTGAGTAGQSCVLLTAPSLAPPLAWTSIATNAANAIGVVSFPDLEMTNFPQRFYQLRWP
jgi:hypothetical protein